MLRELGRVGIGGGPNALSGRGKIVSRLAQLDIGSEQEPIGAWLSERRADTASVHDSRLADPPVELHVGMTTNDGVDVEGLDERSKKLRGRCARGPRPCFRS